MNPAGFEIRRARLSDVSAIADLVAQFAADNLMLPRTRASVEAALRDFAVATDEGGRVVGCCALTLIGDGLAEVRSLAVAPEVQGRGIGRRLVLGALGDARELEVPRVFALTRAPGFFEKLGFSQTEMRNLPQKVWTDCVHCPLFPDCDEVALIREP